MKIKFAATALIVASALIAATPSFAGATRERVKAEFVAAIRSGDFIVSGNSGRKCNEVHPNMHPAV